MKEGDKSYFSTDSSEKDINGVNNNNNHKPTVDVKGKTDSPIRKIKTLD